MVCACTLQLDTAIVEAMTADESSVTAEGTEDSDAPPMSEKANGDFNWTPFDEAPRVAARAWESRPYQVAVWICHPGLPEVVAVEDQIFQDVESACELKDASSWFVNVGTPTGPTRNLLFSSVLNSDPGGEFEKDPMLKFYDKLMVVRLERVAGATEVIVRECDL